MRGKANETHHPGAIAPGWWINERRSLRGSSEKSLSG
jgi:hypothetical protein